MTLRSWALGAGVAVALVATSGAANAAFVCGTNFTGNSRAVGLMPLRARPSPNSARLQFVRDGSPVRILRQRRSWVRVVVPSGRVGWMFGRYVCR